MVALTDVFPVADLVIRTPFVPILAPIPDLLKLILPNFPTLILLLKVQPMLKNPFLFLLYRSESMMSSAIFSLNDFLNCVKESQLS